MDGMADAAHALNKAALVASDCGMPYLATDLCWQHINAYRRVNRAFAEAVIDQAPEGATVLVQDYHLALVGTWLAQRRPDLHRT